MPQAPSAFLLPVALLLGVASVACVSFR